MNTLRHAARKPLCPALARLALVLAPVLTYAAGPGHLGGGGGGGGIHFGGGGGGGIHIGSGGGAARFVGGGHLGGAGHFAGGARFGGGAHFAAAPAYRYGSAPHVSGGRTGAPALHGPAGHPQGRWYTERPPTSAGGGGTWVRPGAAYGGYGYGGGWYYGHPYWGGGYWNGMWWPRVWYGGSFAWFLPVLPMGCAVYWWGGVPYYYWNNVYYAWSSTDNGYVVTDPPPAASDASNLDSREDSAQSGSADVYVYPRNGQSEAQTANDRYECHRWAADQTGFDPTRSSNQGSGAEYRRALLACLDGRGYSAR